MEKDIELQDSINPDEDGELKQTDTEPTGEEGSDDPQLEENAEELETLKAQNAKLYARAKKAEDALKGRKDPQTDKTETDSTPDSEWKQKIEFVLEHKDLDKDQVEMISSFAKGKGISLTEAFEDKLLKKVIDEDKKEKRIANATPDGKSRSPQSTSIQQQIKNATDRDSHKKLWEQMTQGQVKGVESE